MSALDNLLLPLTVDVSYGRPLMLVRLKDDYEVFVHGRASGS